MTMIPMQTHCRTAVLQTGTSLVMASFQGTIPFCFWALIQNQKQMCNLPSCQGQLITKSHQGYLARLKIISQWAVISCLIPKGLPEIWTACNTVTKFYSAVQDSRDQYGCGGLTLPGCQVPTKAALSLPVSTRQRKQKMAHGLR